MKRITVVLLLITTCTMHAMEEELCLELSIFEQQLIAKEIETYGKDDLLAEVRKESKYSSFTWDQDKQSWFAKIPTILEIEKTFHLKNRDTDSLTKYVFDTVEKIEKNNGYRPEYDHNRNVDPHEYLLGTYTKYQPTKNARNNGIIAVRISSEFTGQPHIKKGLEDFILNNS